MGAGAPLRPPCVADYAASSSSAPSIPSGASVRTWSASPLLAPVEQDDRGVSGWERRYALTAAANSSATIAWTRAGVAPPSTRRATRGQTHALGSRSARPCWEGTPGRVRTTKALRAFPFSAAFRLRAFAPLFPVPLRAFAPSRPRPMNGLPQDRRAGTALRPGQWPPPARPAWARAGAPTGRRSPGDCSRRALRSSRPPSRGAAARGSCEAP